MMWGASPPPPQRFLKNIISQSSIMNYKILFIFIVIQFSALLWISLNVVLDKMLQSCHTFLFIATINYKILHNNCTYCKIIFKWYLIHDELKLTKIIQYNSHKIPV
jgi:hypothetical protein